jgi:hypothetical protein
VDLDDLVRHAEAYLELSDSLGDHYELSYGKQKKNQDEVYLKRKNLKGGSNSLNTLIAKELGARRQELGESLVDQTAPRASTDDFRYAFDSVLSQQGKTLLGSGGLRAGAVISPEDLNERAYNIALAHSRGYNPETGAAYGDIGVDAGHKQPHALYPELSTDPANIMPENKYENRIKGKEEDPKKVATKLRNNYLNEIRNSNIPVEYSDVAKAEMAAGPEIMRVNRKEFLKGRRQGRF